MDTKPETSFAEQYLTDRYHLQEVYLRLCDRVDRLIVAVENSGMVHLYSDAERKRGRSNNGELLTSDAEHARLLQERFIACVMAGR